MFAQSWSLLTRTFFRFSLFNVRLVHSSENVGVFTCTRTFGVSSLFFFLFFFLATFDRGNIASFHHLLELHIIPAALFCCHGLTRIAMRMPLLLNPWFGFVFLIGLFAFYLAFSSVSDPDFPQAPVWSMEPFLNQNVLLCLEQRYNTVSHSAFNVRVLSVKQVKKRKRY